MNYLSIPHYRGTKEKYDKSKHADGIFFTTDTHEIIANDTAYNELIKEWTISDGTLTIRMTSGKTYEFNFPTASESQKGIMSPDDKRQLNRLSNSYRDLGDFRSKDDALNALSNIDLCSDSSICHIHCTYSNGNISIDCQQSVLNTYCRQVIFHEEKYFQRNITFTDENRTTIESMEDWACLFGDRLKWKEDTNKYLLSQFGLEFNDAYTDSIPTVEADVHDGLMSKEDKKALDDHIKDYNNPHKVTKAQVGLGNVDNTSDKSKPISDATQTALDGKIDTSKLGVKNGVAKLDDQGRVPASQLPAYVSDIFEAQEKSGFPEVGESEKIYVALKTNLTYRWSGTDYVEISPSIALGETSSTAYAGNKGAAVTERVNKLAKKNISHINDDKPFTSTKDSVTFNYTCFTGSDDWQLDSSHNPSLPVADASHAGILTGTDYSRFNSGLQSIQEECVKYDDTNKTLTCNEKSIYAIKLNIITGNNITLGRKIDTDIIKVFGNSMDCTNLSQILLPEKIMIPTDTGSTTLYKYIENKLETKVDVVPGKGLSSNDFTTTLKNKLDGIAEGANKTIVDDSLSSSSVNPVQNKVVNDALNKKVDIVEGKGLSTKDFTADLEQTLNDLNSWNYIGILSSWNGIAKLNTESTEADILTALTITPLRGNKINTKTELFKVLDQCAINKKFLKESSTNAHVFVEHIGSCYVIQILGNKAAILNGNLVGTPVLRHITISANSNETLTVRKNPFEIKLEDIKTNLDNLKKSTFSHIADTNTFTTSPTEVKLNYTCYDSSMWGGIGNKHEPNIPAATINAAGIMTAADKESLENLKGLKKRVEDLETQVQQLIKQLTIG